MEYVNLGDVLHANQLPPDAEAAIRAKRLELVSQLLREHINVLGDIIQARSPAKPSRHNYPLEKLPSPGQ